MNGDQLDIPEFLRRQNTPEAIAAYRAASEARERELERVRGAARAGMANSARASAEAEKKPERQAQPRVSKNLEPEGRKILEAMNSRKKSGESTNLRKLCEKLSEGRETRVRRRDAKLWCGQAKVVVPNSFGPDHAAKIEAVILAALREGRAGVPERGAKAPEPAKSAKGGAAAAPGRALEKGTPEFEAAAGEALAKAAAKGAKGAAPASAEPPAPAKGKAAAPAKAPAKAPARAPAKGKGAAGAAAPKGAAPSAPTEPSGASRGAKKASAKAPAKPAKAPARAPAEGSATAGLETGAKPQADSAAARKLTKG